MTENDEKFLAAMREAVVANPTYVYPQSEVISPFGGSGDCTYLVWESVEGGLSTSKPTNRPSCVVGHAALNSGIVDMEFLVHVEGQRADGVGFPLSQEVERFADDIQSSQDSGNTWGNAWNEACEKSPGLNLERV